MRSSLLAMVLAIGCGAAAAPPPARVESSSEAQQLPATNSSPTVQPAVPVNDEARDLASSLVKAGFIARDDIVRVVLETVEHPPPQKDAETLVDALLDEQRRAEERWPRLTDNDRLDFAFAELEAQGVVARQHFSDCQTCGNAEIKEELQSAAAAGRKVRGYVYFHMQDTDGAVDGGGLWLAYGAANAAQALEIARDVVRILGQHGLRTEWNGKVEQRIGVKLDWKRRRFTKRSD